LPVYLDNLATTAVDPRVLDAMLPYFREHYGNPSNRGHALGARAAAAVDEARAAVAALVGATADAIVFTSGATESINLALQGVVEAADGSRKRVVTVAGEHKATLDTLAALERRGVDVVTVPVDGEGRVEPEAVARALETPTVLLTCLHGNNEVGTLQPVSALGRIARERGVLFHVDAAQTAGKVPIDVEAMQVDLLSLSAHKFYGPKGVGALFVRRSRPRARVAPQLHGGGQERGLRSGTLNVPGIVGGGAAARRGRSRMADESPRIASLRDRLANRLAAHVPDLRWNGPRRERLPGNLHVSVPGVEGRALLEGLREVALSSGAACAGDETSHVLRAMGVDESLARASLRFGMGRFTTEAEVDFAAEAVGRHVKRLKEGAWS
jgi:cysteine desulfurase